MNKIFTSVAVIILIGLGLYFWLSNNQSQEPKATTGIVEGSLGFPSEGIPEDIVVCAENAQGEEVKCSEQVQDSKYTYGVGYMLELEPASYQIYSRFEHGVGGWENYKAYYNEFVTCGMSVQCESHEPIVVQVEAGQTVLGIDPIDWYNPQGQDAVGDSSAFLAGANAIYATDQQAGDKIAVSSVVLEKSGFVVVHESSQGSPGAIIGNSSLLSAGGSEKVEVDLSKTVIDGAELFAMIHLDNGDGKFDASTDAPATDNQGNPVMMKFRIDQNANLDVEVSL